MAEQDYILLQNRDTDVNDDPGDAGAIIFVNTGVAYIKTSDGISQLTQEVAGDATLISGGIVNVAGNATSITGGDIAIAGDATVTAVSAQFTASAFALAIGAATVDFVEDFNDITDLSFASHAFSVPAGIFRVEVIVDIDNTAQVSAGTYREMQLKLASAVVDFDLRPPLVTHMPLKASTLVKNAAPAAMSVVFTHDAGHAIAGTFTFNITKVG